MLVAALFALAHAQGTPFLHKGDQLAICGDSITEQRMYSRIIETYLYACTPELDIDVRQYGWSGEQWGGFLGRMQNDVLRFRPTVATTCYGMNDHGYRSFDEANGQTYANNTKAAIDAFRSAGVRTLVGSANTIGKVPTWVPAGTLVEMNDSLTKFAAISKKVAAENGADFADVHAVMAEAGSKGQGIYGKDFVIEGNDGVHPGWGGHMVMAYGFLKGLGVSGDIGRFGFDLSKKDLGVVKSQPGHTVISTTKNSVTIESTRYPYCVEQGDPGDANTMASGVALVPFFRDLDRLVLTVKGKPGVKNYRVTWGKWSKVMDAAALQSGLNLAAEFRENPYSAAFHEVDEAVAAKQEFETLQIKTLFRTDWAKAHPDDAAAYTERMHKQLVFAIREHRKPVRSTITVVPIDSN